MMGPRKVDKTQPLKESVDSVISKIDSVKVVISKPKEVEVKSVDKPETSKVETSESESSDFKTAKATTSESSDSEKNKISSSDTPKESSSDSDSSRKSRKPTRYAEMYRSSPRGNRRNWNGRVSNQLGSEFVMNNRACFNCGSFDHLVYNCHIKSECYVKDSKRSDPKAVLLKTGVKPLITERKPITERRFSDYKQPVKQFSDYTRRPITERWGNTERVFSDYYRPTFQRSNCQNRSVHAYSRRNNQYNLRQNNFYNNKPRNTWNNGYARHSRHTVRPSAMWEWKPKDPNGESVKLKKFNYIDPKGRSKSIMAWTPKSN
jgi:hypothetical protein